MIPARIFAGAEDWCRECDDLYDDLPHWEEPNRCSDAGHHRLFDPSMLRWFICDRCKGEGTLRGYPGVYTSDDFDEDPDLADDYMAHTRPCEDCRGLGRIKGVDPDPTDDALWAWIDEQYDTERISAQERRMGA